MFANLLQEIYIKLLVYVIYYSWIHLPMQSWFMINKITGNKTDSTLARAAVSSSRTITIVSMVLRRPIAVIARSSEGSPSFSKISINVRACRNAI